MEKSFIEFLSFLIFQRKSVKRVRRLPLVQWKSAFIGKGVCSSHKSSILSYACKHLNIATDWKGIAIKINVL